MQLSIQDIVPADLLQRAMVTLANAAFEDGRRTAGWMAAVVKNNEQAVADLEIDDLLHDLVACLKGHEVFALAARPKSLLAPLFSRYTPGRVYGTHVDNAIVEGQRADVSFTLFLSPPDTYDGGELIIETTAGEDAIKLGAGSLFLYPSNTLHRVAPVTRGERLAMVGWVRSYIRDPAKRELLFDLETAQRTLFQRDGKTTELDLIAKCQANLMRLWAED